MLQEILVKGYLKYAIVVIGGIGIFVHLLTSLIYHGLIRESENIPTSKSKLIKQIRLKFENCYRLNLGVNNINAFVDKYLFKYRFCGLSLHTMQKFTMVCAWVAGMLGLTGGVACQLREYGYELGVEYEGIGVGMVIVLLTIYMLFDIRYDRNVFVTNMMDFLENSLINRLAHEYTGGLKDLTPEEKAIMNEIPTLQQAVTQEKEQNTGFVTEKNPKSKVDKNKKKVYDAGIIEDVINQYLP